MNPRSLIHVNAIISLSKKKCRHIFLDYNRLIILKSNFSNLFQVRTLIKNLILSLPNLLYICIFGTFQFLAQFFHVYLDPYSKSN